MSTNGACLALQRSPLKRPPSAPARRSFVPGGARPDSDVDVLTAQPTRTRRPRCESRNSAQLSVSASGIAEILRRLAHPQTNHRKDEHAQAIQPARPHALCAAHGYSPSIQSGDLLLVSGRVGAREDGTPEPDVKAQIALPSADLCGVLEHAGCAFDDVVDVTKFFIDPKASVGLVLDALKAHFTSEPKPNVTAVGVTWLAGFQFEIKVIARISRT